MLHALLLWTACSLANPQPGMTNDNPHEAQMNNVDPRSLNLVALSGDALPSETLDGKVVLFVNVASRCGFTKQYDGLQALYKKYKDQGLVVVGVPCNQFGSQEPGTAEEIQSFCRSNYGVEFPLLAKQDVNGDDRSELYKALIDSPVGKGKKVKWNFEKFLVGRDGTVLERFGSSTDPADDDLISKIESAL